MARSSMTYTFHDGGTPRRTRDEDTTDGNGSLSYSAASSVNSGAESADSSILLRGLDVHDSKELANYLEQRARRDEKSVADSLAYSANAESLAYSTDAESHLRSLATAESSRLHGADILGSIGYGETKLNEYDVPQTRQDDGPLDYEDDNILFAPAEHSDSLKKRKKEKRRAKAASRIPIPHDSPRARVGREQEGQRASTSNSRPPLQTKTEEPPREDDDDVWYAKWWMLCFPEIAKHMSPKR